MTIKVALTDRCEGCGDLLVPGTPGRRWHESCRKRKYRTKCKTCSRLCVGELCAGCRKQVRRDDAIIRVIGEMKRWHALYGEPPKAQDWNPVLARRRGNEPQAQRAEGWPHATVVARLFGSWNKAIVAAGYTPRSGRPE